jgi:hypothetical protein
MPVDCAGRAGGAGALRSRRLQAGGAACARIDYEIARKAFCKLNQRPDCKDGDLVSAGRKAKELVIQHWPAIEAVAQKLLKHAERGKVGRLTRIVGAVECHAVLTGISSIAFRAC